MISNLCHLLGGNFFHIFTLLSSSVRIKMHNATQTTKRCGWHTSVFPSFRLNHNLRVMCSLILLNPVNMIKLHRSRQSSVGTNLFCFCSHPNSGTLVSTVLPSTSQMYYMKENILILFCSKMSFRVRAARGSLSKATSRLCGAEVTGAGILNSS